MHDLEDPTIDDGEPGAATSETAIPDENVAVADARPELPGHPRIWWVTGPLLALAWLATIVTLIVPSPYTTDAPGGTYDTSKLVSIQQGVRIYNHPGEFQYVTVTETTGPSYAEALVGWLDPKTDVFPTKLVSGDRTAEQDKRYAALLMDNSKQSAAYQALSLLGYKPQQLANGVFVNQVIKGSPADGALEAGDVITAIDATTIRTTQELGEFMATAKKGQKVSMTVDRRGVDMNLEVKVTLGTQEVEGEPRAYLGIFMETRPHFQLPFTVDFDTGNVGGPSAGLALTLSLIDRLSPEGLTKGHEIAVTGTMQLDGTIGPIGGIIQKTYTVRARGAEYFLVPADNYEEAKKYAGSELKVIPVTTLKGALESLDKLPKAD